MVSIYSGACQAFTRCSEVEDPDWVLYYRMEVETTTRYWAGTSPSDSNFVDLRKVPNVTALQPQIDKHFSKYEDILKQVFTTANSSTNSFSPYPYTKLSESQALVFKGTLDRAWKSRIIFDFNEIEQWIDSPPGNARRQVSSGNAGEKYKCGQGTVDSACKLLKLNNQGQLFLLPWNWELFHNKDLPKSPDPNTVSALSSVVALCNGEAP